VGLHNFFCHKSDKTCFNWASDKLQTTAPARFIEWLRTLRWRKNIGHPSFYFHHIFVRWLNWDLAVF